MRKFQSMALKFITVAITVALFPLMAAGGKKYAVGDLILANYQEGVWAYPARITALTEKGFTVKYEDTGESETLSQDFIIDMDWKVGTALFCNWKGEGSYYLGKITSMKKEDIHVAYNDGEKENTTIKMCRIFNGPDIGDESGSEERSSGSSSIMLTLKNACGSSVTVREEQSGGATYTTDVSSGANIYRSFNAGDVFTITASGDSVEIQDSGWNAIEISSDCKNWCIVDGYGSRNCD